MFILVLLSIFFILLKKIDDFHFGLVKFVVNH